MAAAAEEKEKEGEGDDEKGKVVVRRGGRGGREAWSDYETVFTNAKAGMDQVDREHVKKVVYESSRGSAFFINEQRKNEATERRIAQMQKAMAELTPQRIQALERTADRRLIELEASRDLSRVWLHVDMDAFYAAVEERANPALKEKPLAVGGIGMICTANYEARKFGVRAAMPGFIGLKLCPELQFVKPDFAKYTAASADIREVFMEYDPQFVAVSLDEAYLDITEHCKQTSRSGAEVAEELRQKVRDKTALTCSAGIAPNRMLAKVCSDINKPNGQYALPSERAAITAFITTLPIRKIGGIGKVSERLLHTLGNTHCSHLIEKRGLLAALFSPIAFDFFMHVGLGIGGSEVVERAPEGAVTRKGISTERTFAAIGTEAQLNTKLEELAESLASHMAREGLHARVLTLKLKSTAFEVRTRAVTLPTYISTAEEMLVHARQLLKQELPITARLMGLRMNSFKEESVPEPGQLTLSQVFSRKKPRKQDNNSVEPINLEDDSSSSSDSDDNDDDVDLNKEHATSVTHVEQQQPDPGPSASSWRESLMDDDVGIGVSTACPRCTYINNNNNTVPCEVCGYPDGDTDDNEYACEQCGTKVRVFNKREHEDYHYALRLQRNDGDVGSHQHDRAAAIVGVTGSKRNSSSGGKAASGPMDLFVRKQQKSKRLHTSGVPDPT
eukprot:jgi/Chlat1/2340/Chrsp17S00177